MKIIELIPELTFVYAYDGYESYVLDKKGFKPMILGINKRDNRYFLNQASFFYTEESEITKAVYDFQNDHIEKGYKEDALLFRNLKNSNYKSLVEKMLNILDEKKELSRDKVNSQYVGKSDPNQTSTLKKEVQDGLGNYFHKSDIDNSKVEMYEAEPFRKYFCGIDPVGKTQKVWVGEMIKSAVCWDIENHFTEPKFSKSEFYFIDFSKTPFEIIKQITPDIQQVITPSKNYFLFKLSK